MNKSLSILLLIVATAVGCNSDQQPVAQFDTNNQVSGSSVQQESKVDKKQTEEFKKLIKAIMKERKKLQPVSEEMREAPTLCRAPLPGEKMMVVKTMKSNSDDKRTHGKKLYHLYVKNLKAYQKIKPPTKSIARDSRVVTSPIGQTLIKDSFEAKQTKSKKHVPGKRYAYFIMTKLDPKTPNTDNGWIYATVDADAKTITGIGKIESCMKCHKEANHDRLFGLLAK